MLVTIPFSSEAEKFEPLRACIRYAAEHTSVSEIDVALVLSYFLEAVMFEVGANHLVNIPGFGVFGPKGWQPRNDPDAPPHCYPAFSACRSFRQYVKLHTDPAGPGLDRLDAHRRHHHLSSKPDRTVGCRPDRTMAAWRERLVAQARRIGYVPTTERAAGCAGRR
jgi:nucleoid DNA-binding protein